LAPTGATVTESHLREDAATGELREADITIQYELAGYPINLVIECRDQKRPADVLWIEQLIGKYLSRASQVIAVSRSGFSAQARAKAADVGITAMTIEEAQDTDWRDWVKKLDSIWVTVHGAIMVGVFNINLVDKRVRSEDVPPWPIGTAVGDVMLEFPDGSSSSIWDVFNQHAQNPNFRASLAMAERQSDGLIRWRLGMPEGVQLVGSDGVRRAVEGIGYLVREELEVINVPLKAGQYGVRSIATGSGTGSDWTIRIVFTRDEYGQPLMNLRANKLTGALPAGSRVSLYGAGDPIEPPKQIRSWGLAKSPSITRAASRLNGGGTGFAGDCAGQCRERRQRWGWGERASLSAPRAAC
jgi:hypothetical protein